MVAESGARLLEPDAERCAGERDPAARERADAQPSRGRVLVGARPAARRNGTRTGEEAEALARGVLALGPRRSCSRAGTARRPPTCSWTPPARRSSRSRASATPTAPRTAPAARTPRCSPRSSRSGARPAQAARIARALAGEAVAAGLRDLGAGAGPVDVIGLAGVRARCA